MCPLAAVEAGYITSALADGAPGGRVTGGGLQSGFERHRAARLQHRLVALDVEFPGVLGVATRRSRVLAHLHLQRHLCPSRKRALDDGVRPGVGGRGQKALEGHRGLQLPVDDVVYRVAKAGHVVLVEGQPQVYAGNVPVRELAQGATPQTVS